ncbi:hypothetical protein [Haladaptatus sp. DFWS20]|uniref:hypothetical protein n=1 Tax=Haladaptatus sp. DFWS20 TaxID=3403467 RepID=UPI003EC02F17
MTDESHDNAAEYHYVVTVDDVTDDTIVYICTYHIHRIAICKNMVAVEKPIDDWTLNIFPSENDSW